MALSVNQGFDTFLGRLVPLESQRVASAKHRTSVETSLKKALSVKAFRETGSFTHGTGVRNHTDVDLLVSLGESKPGSSTTALNWVKDALQASFPSTTVRISRPTVVVEFAGGSETWEILPGFLTTRGGNDYNVYDIPSVTPGEWLDSAPAAHLNYVTEINTKAGIAGGAKKLARLIKAWKYYGNVPASSFYLEMRAAKYLSTEKSFIASHDICRLLEHLHSIGLAAMNDPKGASGRFYACSTTVKADDALSKLSTAATRARKAIDAEKEGKINDAFYYWNLVFGGNFPAR
ncbi:SMODS domain-containing nucleotidyltransferase [Lentzea californiensis]|uniref:SMODS domain-containing nucleotidyltransferase n=1 Tax=Lentzea californiensis TaxID=438851 RepID=UPI0021641FB0|nr:nucleotidyltransferase [Lentzea californiensis]MCR3747238.1 hypothetical protein [Lentzea californiensis]